MSCDFARRKQPNSTVTCATPASWWQVGVTIVKSGKTLSDDSFTATFGSTFPCVGALFFSNCNYHLFSLSGCALEVDCVGVGFAEGAGGGLQAVQHLAEGAEQEAPLAARARRPPRLRRRHAQLRLQRRRHHLLRVVRLHLSSRWGPATC